MSLGNSAHDALGKDVIRMNVARRIAKVNPAMNLEEALVIARRALKVLRKVQPLPRISQVINMTHHQLMSVLQECPESPFFAKDDFNLTEIEARRLVLDFVERTNFNCHMPHIEASLSKE